MTQIIMSSSTRRGQFQFWYVGAGRWQDEIEFEDIEIIDLMIRRQLVKAVHKKRRKKRRAIGWRFFPNAFA